MRKNSCEDAVFVRTVEQLEESRQEAYLTGLEANHGMAKEPVDGTRWDWGTRSLNLLALVLVYTLCLWQADAKMVPSEPHLLVSCPHEIPSLSVHWPSDLLLN